MRMNAIMENRTLGNAWASFIVSNVMCSSCSIERSQQSFLLTASMDLELKAGSADGEVKLKPSSHMEEKGRAESGMHRSKVESDDCNQEEQLRAKVAHYYQDPSADLSLAPGKCVDFGDQVAKYSG